MQAPGVEELTDRIFEILRARVSEPGSGFSPENARSLAAMMHGRPTPNARSLAAMAHGRLTRA